MALFGVLTTLQVEVHVIVCRLPTELREQLVKFERQMALVPQLLVEDKVQESVKEAEDRRSHLNKEANEKLKELEKIRVSVLQPWLSLTLKGMYKDFHWLIDAELLLVSYI